MTDVHLLLLAAFWTWFSLILASSLRSRSWTSAGREVAFGNRDQLPDPSPLARRADRAAHNMVENLPLFICAVVAARLAGASSDAIVPGAHVFVWARVVYLGVYLAGVPYLRTLVYFISIVGIATVGAAAVRAG